MILNSDFTPRKCISHRWLWVTVLCLPQASAFGMFLRLGIHHISGGFDHLLFLGALLLSAGGSWRGCGANGFCKFLGQQMRVYRCAVMKTKAMLNPHT